MVVCIVIGKVNKMNKLLDDYLCRKYPRILVERKLSVMESCMGRGFECGNGWGHLINLLFGSIQDHIDNPPYIKAKTFSNLMKYPLLWIYKLTGWSWAYPNFKYVKPEIPQFVATQVKEKFGCLRIYYSGGDETTSNMVNLFERISPYICEECGKYGEDIGRTQGWIRSLCTECATKEHRDIKYIDNSFRDLMNKVREDENKSIKINE